MGLVEAVLWFVLGIVAVIAAAGLILSIRELVKDMATKNKQVSKQVAKQAAEEILQPARESLDDKLTSCLEDIEVELAAQFKGVEASAALEDFEPSGPYKEAYVVFVKGRLLIELSNEADEVIHEESVLSASQRDRLNVVTTLPALLEALYLRSVALPEAINTCDTFMAELCRSKKIERDSAEQGTNAV